VTVHHTPGDACLMVCLCLLNVWTSSTDVTHGGARRVEVAVERNIKIAKDKLPPDAKIVSHVPDVRKILDEP